MYYDNKNKIIIDQLPKNSIGPDNQFYIDFDLANNINLWANHGYFTIRNDSPVKPSEDCSEDISKRLVTIDFPYVDISRVWIVTEQPEQPEHHPFVPQPEDIIDPEI